MRLTESCTYCDFVFDDDEEELRICPNCGARREIAPQVVARERQLGRDALMGEVVQLLKRGQKIEAVKIYREAKNVGLREALQAVEAVQRDLRL